ncbi:MAG TPA: glycerophosphodiester phosphodiesterase family protein [Vitreimonas sp.]|uniref:glycerophosphodiester phosphodiesterase family protein n=1 Tax=Vitreimonas sp. TaxID=3069702 RepID=UPI002D49095D|nr:glycerophosphodiester phosphodiesterase family protein [Vitreimonas sp.]HYD89571.1 glycerophosphodiester phosphodiesterase family protein [Vitreimonas sp.]
MRRVLISIALAAAACTPIAGREHTLAPADLPAFFDCLRESGAAVASAHRGGPAPGHAENAIATLARTLTYAPAFLEVDVSRTSDGALVLMHDDTVDRTTTGTGAVGALTLAQLKALRLRDEDGRATAAAPPTLREALDWAHGRAILELDIKRGVAYEDVVREVDAAGAMERVVFITYSVDGASRLARVAPAAMIYTTIESARDLDTLQQRGVDLSHIVAWLGDGELDQELAAALAARGVESRFGLFGRDDRFAATAAAGVQSIAVDETAAAVEALDAADGEEGYAALQCASAD